MHLQGVEGGGALHEEEEGVVPNVIPGEKQLGGTLPVVEHASEQVKKVAEQGEQLEELAVEQQTEQAEQEAEQESDAESWVDPESMGMEAGAWGPSDPDLRSLFLFFPELRSISFSLR